MKKQPQMLSRRQRRADTLVGIGMILVGLLFFMPIYYMIINAFKQKKEILINTAAFPKSLYIDSFIDIWEKANYLTLLRNSVFVTGVSILFIVIFCSMTGHYIARHQTRLSKCVNIYLVLALVIPFQAVMIPLIKMFSLLGLTDNPLGLIFCYIAFSSPMAVFLFTGAVRGVPAALEESACIDGASWFTTFWRIVFPLLKPITSTVVVLNVFWIWNDFLLPMIVLTSDSKKTIPVGIMSLIMGQYSYDMSLGLAAAAYSAIPMVIIYLSLQKYFIQGIASGAVKE